MTEWAGSTATLALQALPSAIIVFDARYRLVLANQRMLAFAGVDQRWLAPDTSLADVVRLLALRGLYGPGDPQAQIAEAMRLDRTKPSRRMLRHADGTTLEARVQPMADGGFVTCFTDMTALTGPLETAMEDLRRLEQVFGQISQGAAVFGPDDRMQLSNPAFSSLIGLPTMQVQPGMSLADLAARLTGRGELTADEHAEWLATRQGGPRDQRQTYERLRPNGAVLRIQRLPLPGGAILHEVSDISDERRAQDEAQRRASMLDSVLAALPVGVVVWGADRRATLVNAAYNAIMTGSPVTVGDDMEAVLLARARAGEFGPGDPADQAHRIMAGLHLPRAFQRRRPDGRTVSFRPEPLADGGQVVVVTDITPLQEAQAEVQATADRLRTMMEGMRHGIALFDDDGVVQVANALAADLCGLTPAQYAPGRHIDELRRMQVASGDFEDVAALQVLLAQRPALPWRGTDSYLRHRPNGTIVEIRTDPVPGGGMVRTYTDVTALHRAEAAAQARAAMLETMLGNIRHGLVMYDGGQRLIAANPLAAQLTGVADLHRRTDLTLTSLLAAQKAAGGFGTGENADALERWFLGIDRARPQAFQRLLPDGRVFEVVSDPTGDGGFIVTISDVSKLVSAEAEAKRRAEVLGAMLENIRHGICLFDGQCQVLAANRKFHELLDLPAELVAPGRLHRDYVAEMLARGEFGDGPEAAERASRLVGRDFTQPYRNVRARPNGQVLEVVSDPIPGGGFVVTVTDVTEARRVSAELERARDAAEAANAAKSRFLATMSHELRTPLTAVIGFAEALQNRPDAPARGEYLQSIYDAGKHLLSLINDILDVARAEQGSLSVVEEAVDVGALLASVARVMQMTAETAQVTLDVVLPPGLPAVRGDARRLRQVMLNLVSNAVKFTPEGGSVALAAHIEVGGDLLLSVTDTGIGMEEDDIPRAFLPFNQLDSSLARRFEGSGLGLHLSRALAEAQGASLTLRSAPGQGTTAMLRIPPDRLLPAPAPERTH